MCQQKELELIHYDDAKVEYREVKGWVATDGRFWGENEHMARWTSADIQDCDTEGCQNTVLIRSSTICDECSEVRALKKWQESPKKFVTEQMLYSDLLNKYFNNLEDALDYAALKNLRQSELRLYLCEPNLPNQIDIDNLVEGVAAEDLGAYDLLSDEVINLVDKLNTLLSTHNPISYSPSKYALDSQAEYSMVNLKPGSVVSTDI